MTLEEAIARCEKIVKEAKKSYEVPVADGIMAEVGMELTKKGIEEYQQYTKWLKELQERRKQPEIIFCKDCEKHNKRFDEYPADEACPLTVWRVAQEHEFDYQFCAYAERRTDETD